MFDTIPYYSIFDVKPKYIFSKINVIIRHSLINHCFGHVVNDDQMMRAFLKKVGKNINCESVIKLVAKLNLSLEFLDYFMDDKGQKYYFKLHHCLYDVRIMDYFVKRNFWPNMNGKYYFADHLIEAAILFCCRKSKVESIKYLFKYFLISKKLKTYIIDYIIGYNLHFMDPESRFELFKLFTQHFEITIEDLTCDIDYPGKIDYVHPYIMTNYDVPIEFVKTIYLRSCERGRVKMIKYIHQRYGDKIFATPSCFNHGGLTKRALIRVFNLSFRCFENKIKLSEQSIDDWISFSVENNLFKEAKYLIKKYNRHYRVEDYDINE